MVKGRMKRESRKREFSVIVGGLVVVKGEVDASWRLSFPNPQNPSVVDPAHHGLHFPKIQCTKRATEA
jgi:hypothetical protein